MATAYHPLSDAVARLWPPRVHLAGCTRGVMARDTRAVTLQAEQRFSHYPATPMCTINWWFSGEVEMLALGAPAALDSPRSPAPSRIAFGGPFTVPSISWSPGPVHGMMLLLLPDAVHHLMGVDPNDWMNRLVDIGDVLPPDWLEMCALVAVEPDDDRRVDLIEDFLAPRWQAVQPQRALGLHRYAEWSEGLALRAALSQTGRSLRQVERRIRRWAGQPLRELKGFGRAERAFFEMMASEDARRPAWSALALDAGYSDQSHLCRVSRRITGCSPQELWDRIEHDEGFWPYRIWQ